jgi:hypothetical protein
MSISHCLHQDAFFETVAQKATTSSLDPAVAATRERTNYTTNTSAAALWIWKGMDPFIQTNYHNLRHI